MKFIYGKNDWKSFERGEENCYLMTNGLGGFSSLTMTGSCSRNDHAVLMACTHSPNHRYNMIHRLEETLTIGEAGSGRKLFLSSQDYLDLNRREKGYLHQNGFSFEDYPVWTYLADGVEVTRTIVLMQGSNTIGISYEINNASRKEAELAVTPQLQFVRKGTAMKRGQEFTLEGMKTGNGGICSGKISSNGQVLYIRTNGRLSGFPTEYTDGLYYAYDRCDGRPFTAGCAVNHRVSMQAGPGQKVCLELIYSTEAFYPNGEAKQDEAGCLLSVEEMKQAVTQYRRSLREQAGFTDETAQMLSVSANQFISYRNSTDGQTILAGFPFFEDWGRDTMIALGGCCLAVRQYETTRSILRTFMAYCKKGLMPNLFPEGKDAPGYNTVDAALLFILSVYEYYRKTGDGDFVKEAYPVMKEIVDWYEKGTDFGIRMDEDGLILAGQGYDQVTWMDVRVGNILPTPRHGKPVEINAYWYNALRIMEELKPFYMEENKDYLAMAERTRQSFAEKFWNAEAGCLKDVLSGTRADEQIRCNQIWAVSLPFPVLDREQEAQVVSTVFEKLYTPYGLRTLDPSDEEFCPKYGGAQLDRDLAYHQGTVWTFPMGGYYLAYLKVHDYSEEAKNHVKRQLEAVTAALREGCVGQLPEIYDGLIPAASRGCFAQAWSVGEILRVYDVIR
ncbi:MAG: amylo-alpha-1,6-glucosidase [Lachnospiraceae bacterium]|nr:amylo-alpha-1,6-glucosidase [Lachnospiraceae bacterium]